MITRVRATPGTYIVQKMSRIWQHNTDQDLAGYLNLYIRPVIGKERVQFALGAMFRHKSRDNYYNDYSLSPVLTGGQPQYWTDYNSASYNFSPAGNAMGNITTANTNTYTSAEDVFSRLRTIHIHSRSKTGNTGRNTV
jgi:hypothetical protein